MLKKGRAMFCGHSKSRLHHPQLLTPQVPSDTAEVDKLNSKADQGQLRYYREANSLGSKERDRGQGSPACPTRHLPDQQGLPCAKELSQGRR